MSYASSTAGKPHAATSNLDRIVGESLIGLSGRRQPEVLGRQDGALITRR